MHTLYLFCPATRAYELQRLPPEWVAVVHSSGDVVYLHKPTRVCTWSQPYHVSSGLSRLITCEHSIYLRDQFWGITHCLPTLYVIALYFAGLTPVIDHLQYAIAEGKFIVLSDIVVR